MFGKLCKNIIKQVEKIFIFDIITLYPFLGITIGVKTMRKFGKIIALVAVLAVAMTAFVSCSCAGEKKEEFVVDTTPVDYKTPKITVGFNDSEAMQNLITGVQNGDYNNEAVQITGTSEYRGSHCSILASGENGSSVGIAYEVVDGVFPDDYPENGAKVTIVGAVRKTSASDAHTIFVPKDKVTIEK